MNLEEIARLSHKSRSTVSRVINNDPHVSDATRAAVMEVVRRVNFHPNAAARSLAAGRTRVLGLVIPTGVSALFTDPYFPLLVQGVAQACNAHDHSVMLWLAEPEYERRTIGQVLHGGLIDGVILASVLTGDPLLQALTGADATVPFVLVGRQPGNDRLNYVDVDNINSAREAVTHLLRQGRRRVATITGLLNTNVGVDRRDGYLAALRQRSLPIDPDLIVESDFTEAGGYGAMQRLLPCRPDAVFAASDMLAMGALRALREAGRRVPQDVAVVGFDDMPFAERAEPPLTTMRQPVQRTGVVAAETLIDLIDNPEAQPRRILMPTELIIRDSCGARLG
jgi:LacI family transcriptional regulator